MSYIRANPITQVIDSTYSQLTEDFYFESDVLRKIGLPYKVLIPKDFIMDWESVPFLRGKNKIAGLIHDYLCRFDSVPVVNKAIAADVYLEFLNYRKASWGRRYLKYWVVRVAPGYFHAKSVFWNGADL